MKTDRMNGVNVLNETWKQVAAGLALLAALGQLLHFYWGQKAQRQREREAGK
jgi:hypothetical protein